MTLLGRRAGGPRTQLRYHPLVREFLEARLVRELGSERCPCTPSPCRRLRRRRATGAPPPTTTGWRTIESQAHHVIDAAAQDIVAKGEYSLDRGLHSLIDDEIAEPANFEVLRSRRDFKRGDLTGAMARAASAVELEPELVDRLGQSGFLAFNVGDYDLALTYSRRLAQGHDAMPGMRELAEAFVRSSTHPSTATSMT